MIQSMGFAGLLPDRRRLHRLRAAATAFRSARAAARSAGSLVAYGIGITDVDPIEYDIIFERFLNPERISMPDIDVDFCMRGRDQVIRYVAEKYDGRSRSDARRPYDAMQVAQIVTFGTLQAKAAIRDVGRVLGMAFGDVDRIAKLIPDMLGIKLDDAHQAVARAARAHRGGRPGPAAASRPRASSRA